MEIMLVFQYVSHPLVIKLACNELSISGHSFQLKKVRFHKNTFFIGLRKYRIHQNKLTSNVIKHYNMDMSHTCNREVISSNLAECQSSILNRSSAATFRSLTTQQKRSLQYSIFHKYDSICNTTHALIRSSNLHSFLILWRRSLGSTP